MTQKYPRYLAIILAGYLLLGISYALATPPLEASDEYKHYPVVQYVQTQRALPVLDPDEPGLWLQEGAQPPLYYILMGAVTSWIDTEDLEELHRVNPHAFVGDPNQIGNKNLIIHKPENEQFPWEGSVLAIYVIRFASIALGIGTILLTARLGKLLFNPMTGLLAAALTAFNPMFIFVSAAVNNDALAILLGTLALYLLVLLWREAPDPRSGWIRYIILGIVLGLGALTKLSNSGLILLAGIALALLSWKHRQWRFLLIGGTMVLAAALLVTAPWLIRNMREYGDLTGLEPFIAVQGTRDSAATLQDWAGEFGTFYRSFWGLFGGVNVAAPEIFYIACNLLLIAGAAGFLLWLWRNWQSNDPQHSSEISDSAPDKSSEHNGLWLLGTWIFILLVLLIRWNIISPAFQGRLIFPALAAINILWAVGLLYWAPSGWRARTAAVIAALFFTVSAILPFSTIRPAYAYPQSLSEIPNNALFGPISFQSKNDEILLVGVEVPPGQSTTSGNGPIELVLYWTAPRPVESDYLSSIHLLGRDHISEGQVNRYPASGMIPTSQWHPGQIWRDEYNVYVDDDAAAPTRLLLKVGLYDSDQGGDIPAFGPQGEAIDLLVVGQARLGAEKRNSQKPTVSIESRLSDGLTFLGYDLDSASLLPGGEAPLDLYWGAAGTPSTDYTVFVHLLDSGGGQLATADGPPLSGDYPTSLWQKGDVVVDRHLLAIPDTIEPGTYQLSVGLYDPDTLARVQLADGSGDTISWPIEINSGR